MIVEQVSVQDLMNDPANVRTHDRRNLDAIKGSLAKFGQQKPIVIDAKGVVIAGNGTLTAARELGWEKIAVVRSDLIGVEATAYAIADNRTAELAAWDGKALAETIAAIEIQDEDLAKLLDFPQAELDALIGMADTQAVASGSLADKFGVAPFTVLNAREGWWQDRKAAWIALGIRSEVGRGEAVEYRDPNIGRIQAGASPGGSARPAMDYSKRQRGDGRGRPIS